MLNFTNKPYLQLIPILIGLFFASDDQTVVVTILPKIMLDLRIGIGELEKAAWTITGYLIGYVAVMPIMGRFSDIFGRKKIYTLAMIIFIVGSVGTALTGSFDNYNDNLLIERINTIEWVIATRIVQAIGAGALLPVSIAIISDIFSASKRGIPIGLAGGAAEAGAVIGPLYGGLITEFLSWQWVFWLNVPISLIVLALVLISTRSTSTIKSKIDYKGSLLIIIFISSLIIGFSEISNLNLFMATFMIISGLAITIYYLISNNSSHPVIPINIFKNTSLSSASIVNVFYGSSLIIIMVTVPLMTNTVLMGTYLDGGLMLSRMTIMIAIGAVLGGILSRKYKLSYIMVPSLLLCSISAWLMSTWTQDISDPFMSIHLGLAGLGFGLLIAPITLGAINNAPKTLEGTVSGLIIASRFLGMALGIAALSVWGAGKFQNLISGISIPESNLIQGMTIAQMNEYENLLVEVGVSLFSNFYIASSIICLIAIIPCLFIKDSKSN